MLLMSDAYNELLDAAIRQLQDLKTQGVRFVPVSQEGLAALNAPPPPMSRPAAPIQRPPVAAEVTRRTAPTPAAPVAPAPVVTLRPVEAAREIEKLAGETPALPGKSAAFAELRQRVMACVKCAHLASSRKNVVFGVGSIDA